MYFKYLLLFVTIMLICLETYAAPNNNKQIRQVQGNRRSRHSVKQGGKGDDGKGTKDDNGNKEVNENGNKEINENGNKESDQPLLMKDLWIALGRANIAGCNCGKDKIDDNVNPDENGKNGKNGYNNNHINDGSNTGTNGDLDNWVSFLNKMGSRTNIDANQDDYDWYKVQVPKSMLDRVPLEYRRFLRFQPGFTF